MKSLAQKLGVTAFWLIWPVHFFYLRLSKRTRVLLVRGDKILVVRNWIHDGKWGLPGGGLHKDETPLDGAIREIKEEVGVALTPDQVRPIGEAVYRAYGHKYPFYCFIVELIDDVPLKRQWYEIADAQWIDYHDLNARNAGPDVLLSLRAWLG